MSIRVVSSRFPIIHGVWKATNLPLCAVLSPLEDVEEDHEHPETADNEPPPANENNDNDDRDDGDGDDDNQNSNPNSQPSASTSTSTSTPVPKTTFSQPLAAVPKCLNCGAPHPTATTHFRPSKLSSWLLCYLCGEVSSTLITDQQEIRAVVATDFLEFRVPIDIDIRKNANVPKPKPNKKKKGRRIAAAKAENNNKALDVTTTWQLPAMACPPVWWIVVDGTVGGNGRGKGSTSAGAARNYWATVGTTLANALEEIPPHVHVGLITATGSRLASWDLTSAIPHANIEAAIRAMVDGAGSGVFWDASDEDDEDQDEKKDGGSEPQRGQNVPLSLTLEIILEFMEQARHPGQRTLDGNEEQNSNNDGDEEEDGTTKLRYAGGKILCLLGNPALETSIAPTEYSPSYIGQHQYGYGGVNGACHAVVVEDDGDERGRKSKSKSKSKKSSKSSKSTSKKNSKKQEPEYQYEGDGDPTDLTASNLQEFTVPLDPDDMLLKVGSRCAHAALGVDLFVLVPEEDNYLGKSDRFGKFSNSGLKPRIPWYGLPVLRPLSEASGAPGPLMFGTANSKFIDDGDGASAAADYPEELEKFERLYENILARTPWQSDMAFGVQMRLRLSPGFKLDTAPLEALQATDLTLANYLICGGLAGPGIARTDPNSGDDALTTAGDESGGDEDGNVNTGCWVIGTCDSHTSFTVDMETDGTEELPDLTEVDGFGDVELKPVIQTCTLFTCIETDGTGNYYTVCKMRVSSVSLEYTDSTEEIFDGLDLEALSAVLFQKIAFEAYVNGFATAEEVVESWMVNTMGSLYESAQEQYEIEQQENDEESEDEDEQSEDESEEESDKERDEDSEKDSEDESESDPKPTTKKFVAGDRLLDVDGGELDETDILLGVGHLKAQALPQLVYGLINSDALKPCAGNFQPSMDARLCAIAQLASMPPNEIARLLLPLVSLWSLEDDQPILQSVPLQREAILDAIEQTDDHDPDDMILLLESPQRVILFRGDELEASKKGSGASRTVTIGPELKSTILDALEGFRTGPFNARSMRRFLENDGGDLDDVRVPRSVLLSMLLEDHGTSSGDRDFDDWKSKMAEEIMERVGQKEEAPPSRLRRLLPFF
eukprot:jgi/Psemu1/322680/estExt_fgenesh1_pg.C_370021